MLPAVSLKNLIKIVGLTMCLRNDNTYLLQLDMIINVNNFEAVCLLLLRILSKRFNIYAERTLFTRFLIRCTGLIYNSHS